VCIVENTLYTCTVCTYCTVLFIQYIYTSSNVLARVPWRNVICTCIVLVTILLACCIHKSFCKLAFLSRNIPTENGRIRHLPFPPKKKIRPKSRSNCHNVTLHLPVIMARKLRHFVPCIFRPALRPSKMAKYHNVVHQKPIRGYFGCLDP
jgi:hypothetical protein